MSLSNETLTENSTGNCDDSAVTIPSLTYLDFFSAYNQLVFGFIGILGNILLLVAMKRQAMLATPGYLTLAHFSICDFLNAFLAVFYTPFAILTKSYHLPMGIILLAAEWSRKVFISYMSISRFWVIVFPISGKVYFDLKHTKKYLIAVWALCIAVCMPFAINLSVCFMVQINQWAYCPWTPGWLRAFGLATNFTPSVLMICLYPVCFYMVIKQKRKVGHQEGSQNEEKITVKEKHLLYLFSISAVVFTVFWLPYYIYLMVGYKLPFVPEVFELMRGIQTAYNPFVYFWLNPTVRTAVTGVFKKEKPLIQFSHKQSTNRNQPGTSTRNRFSSRP